MDGRVLWRQCGKVLQRGLPEHCAKIGSSRAGRGWCDALYALCTRRGVYTSVCSLLSTRACTCTMVVVGGGMVILKR